MEEKERYENRDGIYDTTIADYVNTDILVNLLNQQDKRIKELEQETYPAYKREHQRRAYLENIEVPKLKERIKELEERLAIQLGNNADNVNFMENQRRENEQLKQQLEDEKNTSAELVSLIDTMRYEDPKINELEQKLQDLPKNILKDIQENFDWNQCCEIRKYYDQPYIWFNYNAFNDFLDTIFKKYGEENE